MRSEAMWSIQITFQYISIVYFPPMSCFARLELSTFRSFDAYHDVHSASLTIDIKALLRNSTHRQKAETMIESTRFTSCMCTSAVMRNARFIYSRENHIFMIHDFYLESHLTRISFPSHHVTMISMASFHVFIAWAFFPCSMIYFKGWLPTNCALNFVVPLSVSQPQICFVT